MILSLPFLPMNEYDEGHALSTVSVVVRLFALPLLTVQIDNQQRELNKSLFKKDVYQSAVTPSSLDQSRSILTGEYHQGHDPIAAKLNPFIEELNSWVDSISLPNKWIVEGIHPPTLECRKLAKVVVLQLLKNYSIYPSRISATIEEGIFINYINHVDRLDLSIEVYNDLDIAAIVTRDKEIIMSADIANENFTEIIQIFKARQLS
jgi:hypothetical protein